MFLYSDGRYPEKLAPIRLDQGNAEGIALPGEAHHLGAPSCLTYSLGCKSGLIVAELSREYKGLSGNICNSILYFAEPMAVTAVPRADLWMTRVESCSCSGQPEVRKPSDKLRSHTSFQLHRTTGV